MRQIVERHFKYREVLLAMGSCKDENEMRKLHCILDFKRGLITLGEVGIPKTPAEVSNVNN